MIVRLTKRAEKDLAGMDKYIAKELVDFLENHVSALEDPRSEGKALSGRWRGYWRYSFGKYRFICEIVDKEITIVVIKIGLRDSVYK